MRSWYLMKPRTSPIVRRLSNWRRKGIPTIYSYREFVEVGGLMAYSIDQAEIWRHLANLIDKIFRGANPGDIPFYQPTKFELSINLKTAKALGFEMPAMLLSRADEVIE
jgi:putative ABC transport system substrate-binding protein